MKTRQQLFNFIEGQKTAFIASVDEDGFPNIKAMFTPGKMEGNDFYFSTITSSIPKLHFMKNPKASIYFYNRGRFKYEGIMLTGTVEVLQDADIKKALWHEKDIMYYSKGVTDPDYCVLKFTAEKGRYYCALKSKSFLMDELK